MTIYELYLIDLLMRWRRLPNHSPCANQTAFIGASAARTNIVINASLAVQRCGV